MLKSTREGPSATIATRWHQATTRTSKPDSEHPWQMAVADYFSMAGTNYLAVADRFTGLIKLFKMDGKAMTLIKTLRNLFAQMGVPEEMASDGGPSFTCYETKQFFKQWGIRHRLSSAHYPQSNGREEVAVKTAKHLLCDNMERGGAWIPRV